MKKRTLPDILTPEEESRLLAVFNQRYPTSRRSRCMILLALNTGMRVSDLLKLQWSDIELATGRTHVKKGKGKKDRVLFIKPAILSDLVEMTQKMGRTREGLIFTTLAGEPIEDSYLRRMIADRAQKAGINKRVYFHLLRHTYLTRLYSQTKDLRLVQEVAGHEDIGTTQIYTHISGEDVRRAMLGL